MNIIKIKSVKCNNKNCKNIIQDENGNSTKFTNENNTESCKYCSCDHSFNCDGLCEYCGQS